MLGIRGATHCGATRGAVGVRKAETLKGRNTGRKAERFMVAVAAWQRRCCDGPSLMVLLEI